MAVFRQPEARSPTLENPLVIYGVALLAGCLLAGLFLGDLLGVAIGVEANVGGVGLAMILLILFSDRLRKTGRLSTPTEQGVLFWSAIYIPVVVAMAAKQNVIAAVKGGPAAILAGVGAVGLSFLLVPVLSRVGVRPGSGAGSGAGPGGGAAARVDDGGSVGEGGAAGKGTGTAEDAGGTAPEDDPAGGGEA